nr:unnamed protein product [Callosobruchus analis]
MGERLGDLRGLSHEFLTEFLEIYKSYPCFWQEVPLRKLTFFEHVFERNIAELSHQKSGAGATDISVPTVWY